MKRVGLIARCTSSGLGHLSKSLYDNYPIFSVLCITDADPRYKDHIDWFPDATFVRWADMPNFPFARFLSEIDVLFCYEIFYDRKLLDTARRMGVRTVLMGMPELTRRKGHQGFIGDPDEYVWPTMWLKPEGERRLPVPVQTIEDVSVPSGEGPLRIVHVAGAPAIGDRNGTRIFMEALKLVRSEVHVRVCVNGPYEPILAGIPPNVEIEVRRDVSEPFWLYADAHVLMMPRRYGGLCLPAHEAMGYGLVVYMTDYVIGTGDYDAALMLESEPWGRQNTPIGSVRTHIVAPETVADTIDLFAPRQHLLKRAKDGALAWAQEHSWANLKPRYDEVLQA
jgi:hypothetical protein